jgi:hypothetical protein
MNDISMKNYFTNIISCHFSRLANRSLWALALCVCFSLPRFASAADMHSNPAANTLVGNTLSFGSVSRYDKGVQMSVAAHSSGLFIEFHKTEAYNEGTIWYQIGRSDGTKVVWGGSQKAGASGYWPAVAISKEGYVILVLSDTKFKSGSILNYRVGKINLSGGVDQSIQWVTDSIHWDAGFHASIAINDNGVVVGVHESGHGTSGLYYRVGHFYPTSGNYTVQWTIPTWGVYYNDGVNPHIALNNRNEVVEVHQVPGENLLHYWRGKVVNSTIQFVSSQRYNDNASQPAVTLLDNGTVVEAHVKDVDKIIVTTGMLSANDPALIEWGSSVGIGWNSVNDINYPALATAGTEVVVTFEEGMSALKYALGKILLQYENGTLVKGSSDKVYVVLNQYRYWIPDPATFDAMGYDWGELYWLSDNELNTVSEGGHCLQLHLSLVL